MMLMIMMKASELTTARIKPQLKSDSFSLLRCSLPAVSRQILVTNDRADHNECLAAIEVNRIYSIEKMKRKPHKLLNRSQFPIALVFTQSIQNREVFLRNADFRVLTRLHTSQPIERTAPSRADRWESKIIQFP